MSLKNIRHDCRRAYHVWRINDLIPGSSADLKGRTALAISVFDKLRKNIGDRKEISDVMKVKLPYALFLLLYTPNKLTA